MFFTSIATVQYAKAFSGNVPTALWPLPLRFSVGRPDWGPGHLVGSHPRVGCVSPGALPRPPGLVSAQARIGDDPSHANLTRRE